MQNDEMFTLIADGFETVTSDGDPNDKWEWVSTSTRWKVRGLSLSACGDVPNYLNAKKGDMVFAVYAIWTTGDSFGQHDGAQIELISVHRNDENGRANAERNAAAATNANGAFEVVFDNGSSARIHAPWIGYFESLDDVQVELLKVIP